MAHKCTPNLNHSHQIQITHTKFKSFTLNLNHSHQIQITHTKFKSFTPNLNHSHRMQIEIIHTKLKSLTPNSNWRQLLWTPILVPRGRAPFGQHQESRPLARSNTGSPRFTDYPSLCACSESGLTNLIGSGSKTKCRWRRPEVAILGADQKERGLWGREWWTPCHNPVVVFFVFVIMFVISLLEDEVQ